MPQEVGSTQDQGLGLAEISRVKGHSQKWQIPARELRRGLVGEARLVTYDADGQKPALVICRADVIGR